MASNQAFTIVDLQKDGDSISFKLTGGLLVPGGGNIVINNNTISGLTNGEISVIEVQEISGVYKFQVLVNGKTTVWDHWSCEFTDVSPDTYSLGISSPIVENHYVGYNSDAPSINSISMRQS